MSSRDQEFISYSEQLNSEEWYVKREIIVKKDSSTCQKCKGTSNSLHVHHTYYQTGRRVWQYPDNSLITLCKDCHKELHNTIKIPILDKERAIIGEMINCKKCESLGTISQFKKVENGICFSCRGRGFVPKFL